MVVLKNILLVLWFPFFILAVIALSIYDLAMEAYEWIE
jgi:hypothetical protein